MLLGPRVDVADVKDLCAEARFCHRDGAVWHRVGEDSAEAAETVVAECRLCPSGRYTALDKATGEPLEPVFAPSIAFVQDPHENGERAHLGSRRNRHRVRRRARV